MVIVSHLSSRIAFTIALRKMLFSTSDNPRYRTTAGSNYAHGTGVSRREGLGAVRGFTVGNTGHSPCFHWESDIERVDPFPEIQRSSFGCWC